MPNAWLVLAGKSLGNTKHVFPIVPAIENRISPDLSWDLDNASFASSPINIIEVE